jgi:hypothetical protein
LRSASSSAVRFNQLLQSIGTGNFNGQPSIIDKSTIAVIPLGAATTAGYTSISISGFFVFTDSSVDAALKFLYPNGIFQDALSVCVLAPTNVIVDVWNKRIQVLNTNIGHDLLSYDQFLEVDDKHKILTSMLSTEVLHRYGDANSPPHTLHLKFGDICILLRHVDIGQGFCNNSRVKIIAISRYRISIQTLRPPYSVAMLPRFRFTVHLPFGKGYKLTRTQFPLRLAYALTANRSQGQEFNRVLVDVSSQFFSHGQLYVAMSRVHDANDLAFFTSTANNTNDESTKCICTTNVVYDELLLDLL